MTKGNIGVTTENIFPVIKKFLYSDHEIFLREMLSNAVDATQKLKTLAAQGEFHEEIGDVTIHVSVDKEAKTITISDHGIGMTATEIEKYINQIAFSGVTDFLEKYKDNANAIIGHFGLGFYSSFMVSDQVEILTRSYQEGANPQRWTCDGSPEYELTDAERSERGTDVILHIADDCAEFLEKGKIGTLLDKYCKFMPIPIAFGKETEWKDGKQVETERDNIINSGEPLWTKAPNELKDEDYKSFYRTLYPMGDEPLFWIHLNVDFPFHLTGILYFPRVRSNIELQKNKILLYCNQVFVTDQVEGIVPEFLTLLHGVIDSPDIPLNVSRSYLQSDANVKKIASYITKKVSDRLKSIFNENRKDYEEKWESLKLFIHYGLLTQEDFYDRAKEFALFRDIDGKYFTYEEYQTLIKDTQTDKDGNLIYLYATNREEQYSHIEVARAKGYSVLLMDGELEVPCVSLLEQKFEKSRFARVDADVVENLIKKEEREKTTLSKEEADSLSEVFRTQLPKLDKTEFIVEVQSLGEESMPLVITLSEYMRRMKDMSRYQAGMSFYGEMPDSYTLIVNSDHPLVKKIQEECAEQTQEQLKPILSEIKGLRAREQALQQSQKDKKWNEITQEEKDDMSATRQKIQDEETKRSEVIKTYAQGNGNVQRLVNIALLQNGMLKGAPLNDFLKNLVEIL